MYFYAHWSEIRLVNLNKDAFPWNLWVSSKLGPCQTSAACRKTMNLKCKLIARQCQMLVIVAILSPYLSSESKNFDSNNQIENYTKRSSNRRRITFAKPGHFNIETYRYQWDMFQKLKIAWRMFKVNIEKKRSHASKRSSTRDKYTFMTKVVGISLFLKKWIHKVRVIIIKSRILKTVISKFCSYHCCCFLKSLK